MPNLPAMFTGGYEITLLKRINDSHGLILLMKLLQAFTMVSLRRMTITSMIFTIREGISL
jgi:hypothetical protein